MKTWTKILIVFITFGASAAVAYAGTLPSMAQFSIPCSLFSGAFGALGAALTGFTPTK
jgi:hypothetical protein